MIRVICTHEGYFKAGIAWAYGPTYCEEGFLTAAQIQTLTASQITPDSPRNRIVIDLDMPEPKGDGWTIHRMTGATAPGEAASPVAAPVISSPEPAKPRGRPPKTLPAHA